MAISKKQSGRCIEHLSASDLNDTLKGSIAMTESKIPQNITKKQEVKKCTVCNKPLKRNALWTCSVECKKLRQLHFESPEKRLEYLLSKTILTNSGCMEYQTTTRTRSGGHRLSSVGGKLKLVHRQVYELHAGEDINGSCVFHTCDNPKCINPEHLFLGSQLENMQDMVKKMRYVGGKNNPNSKEYHEKIASIKKLNSDNLSYGEIR